MARITQFATELGDAITALNTVENWQQAAVIMATLGLAWLITRLLGKIHTKGRKGVRPLASRQTQRVLYPLIALLLLGGVYGLYQLLREPMQVLRIAIVLMATHAIIRLVFTSLRRHFAPTPTLTMWLRIIGVLIWLAVLLYLSELLPPLLTFLDKIAINIGDTRISLLSAINVLILTALLFSIAIWISAYLERRLSESTHLSVGIRLAMVKVTRVVLIILAVIIALDAAGIGLTTLAVFSGAIGVGIGFGLQRTASNFITGFLLLFDRAVRPGDVVKVGERIGIVQELRARYIVLKDFDGVSTLIPNEHLITGDVVNWSYGDHTVRIKIPVEISYENDPESTRQLLVNIAAANPRVLTVPPPEVQLIGFGDNGLKLELFIWIDDPENGLTNVRSEINLQIWQKFKEHHIQFPYPQHDIHVKAFPADMVIAPVK